jgi:hypothetical protein
VWPVGLLHWWHCKPQHVWMKREVYCTLDSCITWPWGGVPGYEYVAPVDAAVCGNHWGSVQAGGGQGCHGDQAGSFYTACAHAHQLAEETALLSMCQLDD